MADKGAMSHNPPPGTGMSETIFREHLGGMGDFYSRRDHDFMNAGPRLGATVKGPYK